MGYLRFTLALLVQLAHSGYGSGTIGALASVQAFFVLSGIYMAAVYRTRYGMMPDGARVFYLNRGLRLWPTYLILLLLTYAVYLMLGRPYSDSPDLFDLFRSVEQQGNTPANALMLVIAIFLFGQDVASVVEHLHYMLPVRQSWSIATELLFYLTVPLLYRLRSAVPLFLAFVVLMGLKLWLLGIDWRLSYFLPCGNFGYFALGYGLYMLFDGEGGATLRSRIATLRVPLLLSLICLCSLFGEASFERGGLLHHLSFVALFSLGSILLFEREGSRLELLFGNISYGIYLNHFLILILVGETGAVGWTRLVLVLGGSLSLAALIERFVQRPIDRYRYRRIELQSPTSGGIRSQLDHSSTGKNPL